MVNKSKEKDFPHLEFTLNLLKNLIGYPTVHPGSDAHQNCIDFLKRELEIIGFETNVFEADLTDNSERAGPILLAYLTGRQGGGLHMHFNGHYDVVPVGNGWQYPPFEMTLRDEDLIGRGTADMKGGIATIVGAIKSYITKHGLKNGTISLSIVPDEERGGKLGSKYVVEKLTQPDIIFIPEPSLPYLYKGHRGVAQWIIKVGGIAAHASVPSQGKNAFLNGMAVIDKLYQHHNAYIQNYPDKGSSEMPTIMPGGIVGAGTAINVVPDEFTFSLDRRIAVDEDIETVLEWFDEWLRTVSKEFSVSAELKNLVEPTETLINDPLVSKAIKSISQAANTTLPLGNLMGFADMWYFTKRFHAPGLIFGPGRVGQSHVPNEKVTLSDIDFVYSGYEKILSSFFDDDNVRKP